MTEVVLPEFLVRLLREQDERQRAAFEAYLREVRGE